MTQDEVMELAREVGFVYYGEDCGEYNIPAPAFRTRLTLLANSIEAKLMERLLAGAGEPVANLTLQQGRVALAAVILNDGVYDLYTDAQVAAAVLREREKCAKVCVPMPGFKYSPNYLGGITQCAEAIRARGNKT